MFKKLKRVVESVRAAAESVAQDPETEEVVQQLAEFLVKDIIAKKGKIDLDAIHQSSGVRTYQLRAASKVAYQKFAANAWKDKRLSKTERKQLLLICERLHLDKEAAQNIEVVIAGPLFVELIHECLTDNTLDTAEKDQIKHMALDMGIPSQILIQRLMRSDAKKLLQRAFSPDFSCSLDDQILHLQDINQLALDLGFTKQDLAEILCLELQDIVHFAITESETDETPVFEEQKLVNLIHTAPFPGDIKQKLEERIRMTAERGRLESGTQPLPQVVVDWVESKPGEIWHLESRAIQTKYSRRQSEVFSEELPGRCAVSHLRIVFESSLGGISDTSLRTIKSLRPMDDHNCKIITGRSPFNMAFVSPNGILLLGILYKRAIGKGSSTANERRRVSRDVRQQVWSRDGGQCVECGADDYLEYDHIIPVAKGGSNSLTNIQLLCRRCNSEKSDAI